MMSDVLLLSPDSAPSSQENKWVVIVDRASLLLIQALLGVQKVQEQSWRLLELHSLKIVSSGIIWVSLQEVGCVISACVCVCVCVKGHECENVSLPTNLHNILCTLFFMLIKTVPPVQQKNIE